MENFKELSIEELKTIRGGDWIRDFGSSCHKLWYICKDVLDYLNEVGKGGKMHSAG
ncbi:bacteriocin [Flavobacterium sp. WV_118_3]|uniref:bacteriocin n=1 Tax=Flavobacterium sp. WV_118_3 TaxID=3151764 RepID=UPI003219698C